MNDYLMLFIGLCLISFCTVLRKTRSLSPLSMTLLMVAGLGIIVIGTAGIVERMMLW